MIVEVDNNIIHFNNNLIKVVLLAVLIFWPLMTDYCLVPKQVSQVRL